MIAHAHAFNPVNARTTVSPMSRILTVLILACALALPVVVAPAQSQTSGTLHNPRIKVQYVEPKYEAIYRRLQQRKILEELDAFLSPLRLEQDLTLSLDEGGGACARGPNSFYSPDEHTIHICYSWFDMLENDASVVFRRNPGQPFGLNTPGLMPGFTRAEVLVGGTVGLVLHETGHAIFDIENVPRLGREEDAADQVAAFMMLQFGPKVARTTIKGTINVWHSLQARALIAGNGGIPAAAEADEHSLSIQRVNNYLCMAFGSELSADFKDLAGAFLSAARQANCVSEYRQAALAFKKTLWPKVDPELVKKVQQMEVIRPEDGNL
jgi:hypothetical protein